MKKITFLVVLALLLSLSTLVACGGGSTPTSTSTTVTMGGTSFDQSSVTVSKGSTITFMTDPTGTTHNLVNGTNGKAAPEAGAPSFGGGQLIGTGKSWVSPPWNTAGTFHVTCTFHPNTMTMTVTVTG
ncbi:MAG TPA: plastocyanin/azurin family copper-binding protein [Ktedonobacteraceae bacterium]|nr:plastocyanin/azurin family copper-binding protein [Ktedonobacteraceae bacterium]